MSSMLIACMHACTCAFVYAYACLHLRFSSSHHIPPCDKRRGLVVILTFFKLLFSSNSLEDFGRKIKILTLRRPWEVERMFLKVLFSVFSHSCTTTYLRWDCRKETSSLLRPLSFLASCVCSRVYARALAHVHMHNVENRIHECLSVCIMSLQRFTFMHA